MGFGPYSDFDHFGKPGGVLHNDPEHVVTVLCEGCGPTFVDHLGRCTGGCDCQHVPPGDDEVLRRHEAWQQRRGGVLGLPLRLWDWWAGTGWEPGYWHYLKHLWYTRRMKGDEFDFLEQTPPTLDTPGSDGALFGGGTPPDAQGRGPDVDGDDPR